MAINKKVQFLRNNSIYTGATGAAARTAAIAGMRGIATGSTTSGEIVDGQAILARYNAAGSASTGDVQTIYGIVHKGVNSKTGVTVYESSELLWAAINESVSTSTTISAGTGLSGGGQLNTATVTLRHDTTTRQDTMPTDPTVISNGGSFTAVTNVASNTLGHVTGVTKTVFNLPSTSDSAVTQDLHLGIEDYKPILVKTSSGTASTTSSVWFVTAATLDAQGRFSAKTSVSTSNVSATTVSGANIYGATAISGANITAATAVRAGNVSAGTISAGTSIRAGNVSAGTISAGTSIYSPSVSGASISGGSITASGNVRGGNVSAATISAATSIYSQSVSGVTVSGTTIKGTNWVGLPVDPDSAVTQNNYEGSDKRPIVLKAGTGSASTTSAVSFVTNAKIDGVGNIEAASLTAENVTGTTISGTTVKGVTVSGGTIKGGTISGTSYSNLPTASSERDGIVKVVETTGDTSGSTVMSQKAVTDAITGMISVADALVYKGTVAGTATSPGASLPAANKGDVYKVSSSGYVAGVKVEAGDMFICNTDNTASGTASTNWDVIQTNVDMANYVQTARTVTAGTGLSGGGNLGSDVTIRHQTATVNTLTDVDQTQIGTARTFTAVTAVTDDGMGHMSSVMKAIFKLPDDVDSAVTQERLTASTFNPIVLKVDSGTSASANGKVYYSSAATVDKGGNIKTTGNVSGATISGANIYGATAISGANISAATAVRAGNVSAGTISAGTSIRAGNVSAGTISAGTDLRAGNVSAATISAATHIKAPILSATTSAYMQSLEAGTGFIEHLSGAGFSGGSVKAEIISAGTYQGLPVDPDTAVTQTNYTASTARPIVLKNGTGTGSVTSSVTFVTAATIDGSGGISAGSLTVTDGVNANTVMAPNIEGTAITAADLVTASGFSATTNASTASTDINASILLSNGKNTNIIDCGTY